MEKIDSLLDTVEILTAQVKALQHERDLFKKMYGDATEEIMEMNKVVKKKEQEEW